MLRANGHAAANPFAFWLWCISLISPVTYNETSGDSSSINPSSILLSLALDLGFGSSTFHALLTRRSLLTSRAGGVGDSFM